MGSLDTSIFLLGSASSGCRRSSRLLIGKYVQQIEQISRKIIIPTAQFIGHPLCSFCCTVHTVQCVVPMLKKRNPLPVRGRLVVCTLQAPWPAVNYKMTDSTVDNFKVHTESVQTELSSFPPVWVMQQAVGQLVLGCTNRESKQRRFHRSYLGSSESSDQS